LSNEERTEEAVGDFGSKNEWKDCG